MSSIWNIKFTRSVLNIKSQYEILSQPGILSLIYNTEFFRSLIKPTENITNDQQDIKLEQFMEQKLDAVLKKKKEKNNNNWP